jgi:hypothetical protein
LKNGDTPPWPPDVPFPLNPLLPTVADPVLLTPAANAAATSVADAANFTVRRLFSGSCSLTATLLVRARKR